MRFGWNGENFAVRMSDIEWKTYSGLEWRWRFHTCTMPLGSWGAVTLFVYEARTNSGNYTADSLVLVILYSF